VGFLIFKACLVCPGGFSTWGNIETGQARVLTPEQFAHLLGEIKEHRYPDKNTALI